MSDFSTPYRKTLRASAPKTGIRRLKSQKPQPGTVVLFQTVDASGRLNTQVVRIQRDERPSAAITSNPEVLAHAQSIVNGMRRQAADTLDFQPSLFQRVAEAIVSHKPFSDLTQIVRQLPRTTDRYPVDEAGFPYDGARIPGTVGQLQDAFVQGFLTEGQHAQLQAALARTPHAQQHD